MTEIKWTTQEQDFMHQYFLMEAKKLDKEELLEIFEQVHKQYLIKSRFLNSLIKWCLSNGIVLPNIDSILS